MTISFGDYVWLAYARPVTVLGYRNYRVLTTSILPAGPKCSTANDFELLVKIVLVSSVAIAFFSDSSVLQEILFVFLKCSATQKRF